MTGLSPLRREIVVTAGPDTAYRVFVERIGQWWPLAKFSVYGADADVAFEGADIVEVSPDGERSIWGSVTARRPGKELSFTWHPGRDADGASRVTVTFLPNGDGTLVRLVHEGWEIFADPEAARTEYGQGWPTVLGLYGDEAGRAA